MNKQFIADAARWEAGELTDEELAVRYPAQEVRALTDLSARLSTLVEMPTPDAAPGWLALRERLPDRIARRERSAWRIRRPVLAAVTAAMLAGTTVAYAAGVEPVRRGVDRIVHDVTVIFTGDDDPAAPRGPAQGSVDGPGQPGGPDQGNPDDATADQGGSGSGEADQGNVDQSGSDEGGADQDGGIQGNGGPDDADQGNVDQGGVDQGGSQPDGANEDSENSGGSAQGGGDQGNANDGNENQGGVDGGGDQGSAGQGSADPGADDQGGSGAG